MYTLCIYVGDGEIGKLDDSDDNKKAGFCHVNKNNGTMIVSHSFDITLTFVCDKNQKIYLKLLRTKSIINFEREYYKRKTYIPCYK